jgi:SAM-dependent methyltransferase
VCSADQLPFDDMAFETVSVRFGHMFFPDPGRTTAELARVLAPGGRLCSAVWGAPQDNPWVTLALQAVATEFPLPAPDPDAPGMFRLQAPGSVSALFEAAGLEDVAEWDVPVELVTASAEQYWAMISEHASPVAAALQRVDPPARARIRAAAVAAVGRFARDGRTRVPGVARCIVGTKGAVAAHPD